jgi:hypothetical protein
MAELITPRGFFSILRWRSDPTRDEAKNVAVVLIDEKGTFGGVRAAPLSRISPKLQEQGLLDAIVVELEKRFQDSGRPTLADLESMRQQLQQSLYLTELKPVAVPDVDVALGALYRAYIAPPSGGSHRPTKGAVLDRVVNGLRRKGYKLARSQYVEGFLFDLVLDGPKKTLGEVLSFATDVSNWAPVENDAGHFLYGLHRLRARGLAVVQPPSNGNRGAHEAYERVRGWLDAERVRTMEPDELLQTQGKLPL